MTHVNMCSGCGLNFSSVGTFDKHRVGIFGKDRRCLTEDEMKAKGWERTEALLTLHEEGKPYKKKVPTWSIPMSDITIARLHKQRKKGTK